MKGKIRPIKKRELKEMRDVIYSSLKNSSYKKDENRLRKKYQLDNIKKMFENSKIFIFEKNKKILATGRLDEKEICTIYVKDKFKRKGIGTQMVRKVENYAKKKNIEKVELYPRKSAIEFYKKLGYKFSIFNKNKLIKKLK